MVYKKYKNELIRQAHDWMVEAIYEASKLEGVPFTFPETEEIVLNEYKIANKYKNNENALEIVINLKRAYQAVLQLANQRDYKFDYKDFLYLNRIIGVNLIHQNGNFRTTDVKIKHSTYKPPFPTTPEVWKERIDEITKNNYTKIAVLNLYAECMKQQYFNDGNKRTALLFANTLLLSKEMGFIELRDDSIAEFGKNLISYYENKISQSDFVNFIDKKHVIKSFDNNYHKNGIEINEPEEINEYISSRKK